MSQDIADKSCNYYGKRYCKSNEILQDKNIQSAKVAGEILDIKERSNKDGKKYAFVTVSGITDQFELAIFTENLT